MGHGWGYGDPAGYLNDLKTAIGITAMQEPAWTEYASSVKGAAEEMQGVHRSMYEAMGTANWEERRDMMNRMFQARQQTFATVHTAAEKLLPVLDPDQRARAELRLPGLVRPGYGMTEPGRMGPVQR